MNDDMHDDGLVHSHGWATEPPATVLAFRSPRPMTTIIPAPDHDDGLVHSHGWACGQRGAPAHR